MLNYTYTFIYDTYQIDFKLKRKKNAIHKFVNI
jgi:hypothetical protein